MCAQTRPTQKDLDRLMDVLRPGILALFEEREVSEAEAERLVSEVLTEAAWRWSRLRDPAEWVLKTLDRKTWPKPETDDEETVR